VASLEMKKMNPKRVMNFQKKIKEHLQDYKFKYFSSVENGTWRKREKCYPHILPKDKKKLNLLPKYRDSLSNYMGKNSKTLKPHTYFHHLNSSQAMCLNFFYPLIKEKELGLVLNAIGLINEKVEYSSACFEKKSIVEKVDKNYRATYFDFYMETVTGKNIYFEIKYTEQQFGKVKLDELHSNKFDKVYKNKLDSINKKYSNKKDFLENYQILRNLICVTENSYVVFVYPNDNKKIRTQAEFARKEFLKENLKNNLINLTWENLTLKTEKETQNNNIKTQLKDFKEKYMV
jgi:hypothetical protein